MFNIISDIKATLKIPATNLVASNLKLCHACWLYSHSAIKDYVLVPGDGDFTDARQARYLHGNRGAISAVLRLRRMYFFGCQKKKNG